MPFSAELQKMVSDRQAAFIYEKVFDEDVGRELDEMTKESHKDVDTRAYQIRKFIFDNFDVLEIDQMVESITMLGGAPSVVYDDNGWFTIASDSYGELSPTLVEGFETQDTQYTQTYLVDPGAWHQTIRGAMRFYMNEMFKDDVYANPEKEETT